MRKVITTEEYGPDGRLIKCTVTTEEDVPPPMYPAPLPGPYTQPYPQPYSQPYPPIVTWGPGNDWRHGNMNCDTVCGTSLLH
jgi:hypothetical protein